MSEKRSRTRRFFYGTVTTALYQLALFLSGMIVPKATLVYYSSEINGLATSITQFIAYFNLVEAGLSGAAIYALYKPLAERDFGAASSVVVAAKNFYVQAGTIFLALLTFFAFAYPFMIETDAASAIEIVALVFVLGAGGALEFFTLAKYRALLAADQKTYVISLASIVQVVLNTMIIYVLAICGVHIVVLRAVATLSIFARTALLWLYVRRKYPWLDYKAAPKKDALDKRWDATYMQVLGAIHSGAPVVILTLVVGDLGLVSVFSIYSVVVAGLHGIMSVFSGGLSAGFGDVIVRKQDDVLKSVYRQFETAYLAVMTTVYATAAITILPFVKIYTQGVSDVNYLVPTIGFLIVLNGFFYHLKSPQATLLIAAGLYKESRVQTTIQGAIMVVFGCVFAYYRQIEGMLIACVLSNLYRAVDLLFFIPKRVTRLPIRDSLSRWLRACACFAALVVAFRFVPSEPNDYWEWSLRASAVFAVSAALAALNVFCFDRKPLFDLLARMKKTKGKTNAERSNDRCKRRV